MRSLFELAQFYQEKAWTHGDYPPPQYLLDVAACKVLEGYGSLEEASEENNTRYDAWGNEIECSVIHDAVAYLQHASLFISQQLKQRATSIDNNAGEAINRIPETKSLDRLVERMEKEAIRKCELLEHAAQLMQAPVVTIPKPLEYH